MQKLLAAVNTTFFVAHMQQADPEDLQSWGWILRVSKMFHETGTTERAMIQFKFEGTIT